MTFGNDNDCSKKNNYVRSQIEKPTAEKEPTLERNEL